MPVLIQFPIFGMAKDSSMTKVSFGWIARQCFPLGVPLDLFLFPLVKYVVICHMWKDSFRLRGITGGGRFSILFCLITYASLMVGLPAFSPTYHLLSVLCAV